MLTEHLDVLVEQREVELQLPRKVLVEDGLGDAGTLGDVVHRGRVVAVGHEHGLRGLEQQLAPRRSRQPLSPVVRQARRIEAARLLVGDEEHPRLRLPRIVLQRDCARR